MNKKAPTFKLPDQLGNIRTLDEFKGNYVLLYFYPKDMTPGCTVEAQGFQDLHTKFKKQNTVIIGISKDSIEQHQKFCDKEKLDIILLSDTETSMIQKYGVWKEKSMFGKKYMGISRESFLVDPKGIIINHWKKVNPINHPKQVLEYVKDHV